MEHREHNDGEEFYPIGRAVTRKLEWFIAICDGFLKDNKIIQEELVRGEVSRIVEQLELMMRKYKSRELPEEFVKIVRRLLELERVVVSLYNDHGSYDSSVFPYSEQLNAIKIFCGIVEASSSDDEVAGKVDDLRNRISELGNPDERGD